MCATGNWTFIITFFFFSGHGGSPPQTGCQWCHNLYWDICPGSSLPHHDYLQTWKNSQVQSESGEIMSDRGMFRFLYHKSYTRTPTTSYEETDRLVCVPSLTRLLSIQDGCIQPNRVLRRVWGPEDFISFNPWVWHNFSCPTAELNNAPCGHFFIAGDYKDYRKKAREKNLFINWWTDCINWLYELIWKFWKKFNWYEWWEWRWTWFCLDKLCTFCRCAEA